MRSSPPRDYPLEAPAYAAQRSTLAKTLGLGRKGGLQAAAEAEPEEVDEAPTPAPKRGRAKKTA